jgi:hypothetical protein
VPDLAPIMAFGGQSEKNGLEYKLSRALEQINDKTARIG